MSKCSARMLVYYVVYNTVTPSLHTPHSTSTSYLPPSRWQRSSVRMCATFVLTVANGK